jgi:hypothetical protein
MNAAQLSSNRHECETAGPRRRSYDARAEHRGLTIAMKPIFVAAVFAAAVIASTTQVMGQDNPPAAPVAGGASGVSTPSNGDAASNSPQTHPAHGQAPPARHHKKKPSLGKRLRSSVEKKLQRFIGRKEHATPSERANPQRSVPPSQIE